MKYAIISDVHANPQALERVLVPPWMDEMGKEPSV